MKAVLLQLLLALLLLPTLAVAHSTTDRVVRLDAYEAGVVLGFVHATYTLNALEGPLLPYVCEYSVVWDEFYQPVEWNVRHYLTHLTRRERRELNVQYIVWRGVLQELGCGGWYPEYDANHPHE